MSHEKAGVEDEEVREGGSVTCIHKRNRSEWWHRVISLKPQIAHQSRGGSTSRFARFPRLLPKVILERLRTAGCASA